MRVRDVRLDDSPDDARCMRLRGVVDYAAGGTDECWYDVPRGLGGDLTENGNAWAACLLPLAATLGEPLRVSLPVDAALAANARRLTRIWRTWYPELHEVELQADVETGVAESGRRVGAFFSGGVDSFFTLLRDRPTAAPVERRAIDDVITVCGFDISLARRDAFARLRERHCGVALQLGLTPIDVTTNLRSTRWQEAQWSYVAHGAALASIALLLGHRFAAVYVAGGGGYRGLHPWGSHSVTDPLFSTSGTAIVYDGVAYLRTEKLEALAHAPLALENLRVCYETWTEENCGQCNKCLRTMVGLEACGVLAECPTLPRHEDLLGAIARMDATHFADFRELEDLRGLAAARGRDDVVRSIGRCLRRARVLRAVRAGRRWIAAPARGVAAMLRSGTRL